MIGEPGHRPAVRAVGVDGKERKLAKAGGKQKVHLLAAVAHHTGVVISQDRVAKAGKANEITHFKPLLEPLPLTGVLITADAMQTQRAHARWVVEDKDAHYLLPVLGNRPACPPGWTPCRGKTPRSRPPRPRCSAAGSRPAPSASCPPRTAWTSRTPARRS